MSGFLTALGSFVSGLLAMHVPVLGISMLQLILGLWVFYACGQFVFSLLHGGDD